MTTSTLLLITPPPTPPPAGGLPGPSQWLVDTVTAAIAWCTARPWLAAVAAALVAAGYTAHAVTALVRHRRMARHATLLTITPPPEVDPAGAAAFWATLAEILTPSWRRRWRDGRSHIAVEYRWSGRQLTVALWIPGTVQTGPIQAAVRGAWPGAACTATDALPPLPVDGIAAGGALAPTMQAWYPLETDHDADPMRTLIAAASQLHAAESACVQVLARPATARQTRKLRRGVQVLRSGKPPRSVLDPATWLRVALELGLELFGPTRRTTSRGHQQQVPLSHVDPQRDRDARAGVDKLPGPQWEVAIRYAVVHTNPRGSDPDDLKPRVVTLAHGIASAFGAWNTGRNRLRRLTVHHPTHVLATRVLRRGFLLSAAELASIAALPQDIAVPGLDRARAKPMPAPVAVLTGGRGTKVLGRAEVGGHGVALRVADARQHLHVLGSTGSGKSTLLLNMILDDIHARRGVVVIDPKGDLVIDLLDRIPAKLAKRLVLIDPDQPAGTTLNPLAGDDHDLVVDNVVSIFGKIFAKHWGPRMDDVLRVACLTLLRKANATLTLIPSLLQDRKFRHAFTADLDDPEGLQRGSTVSKKNPTLVIIALAALVASAVLPPSPAVAQEADSPPAASELVPTTTPGSVGVATKPGSAKAAEFSTTGCTEPTDGSYACLTVAPPEHSNRRVSRPTSVSALAAPPEWCDFNVVRGTRTQACVITTARLDTYTVRNGVRTWTGYIDMDFWNNTYSSPNLGNWVYEIWVVPFNGQGAALGASVSGTTVTNGPCTRGSASFPTQPLTPFLTPRTGEAHFHTTATAVGAVGQCETIWELTFTVPQHTPAVGSQVMFDIRCDNATGANGFRPRRVGCVVPWYPSAVGYSQSEYPSLASHVSRAQASGLPGATFTAPLFRSTNEAFTTQNRQLACGDAPSITGRSCDEYPLASTYNGLAFGGSRRSFSGCNINAPTATGASGASACMITASENNAQGALMAAFYYDERVLNWDPYRVLVIP